MGALTAAGTRRTIGELSTKALVEGLTQALSGGEHGGGTASPRRTSGVVSGVGNGTADASLAADVAWRRRQSAGRFFTTCTTGSVAQPLSWADR